MWGDGYKDSHGASASVKSKMRQTAGQRGARGQPGRGQRLPLHTRRASLCSFMRAVVRPPGFRHGLRTPSTLGERSRWAPRSGRNPLSPSTCSEAAFVTGTSSPWPLPWAGSDTHLLPLGSRTEEGEEAWLSSAATWEGPGLGALSLGISGQIKVEVSC